MSLPAEFIVVVFGILLALVAPLSLKQTRHAAGRCFRRIGRSDALTLLVAFLLPLVILPALTLRSGIPHPYVHDEFVYLLMGETFSRGEMTNPTPEHAEHFRSPHLILEPTYQGKYPVAQGLFIAVGKLLTGYSIAGVWFSFALASAAVCWLLQAWTPNRWALLGATLFSMHPMISIAWGETYWGGAIAAMGGALVFGSIARLERRLSWKYAVALGTGLIALANSRPYEGLVASVPAAIWFVWICWSWVRRGSMRDAATVALTSTVVLVAGMSLLAMYNRAVTGSALKLPYQVWLEQTLDTSAIGTLLVDENASSLKVVGARTGPTDTEVLALPNWQFKMLRHYFFFLRVALAVPLLAVPWILRKRRVALCVAAYLLVFCCVIVNRHSGWPHYYAPATPLLIALVVHGVRQMSASGRRLRCLATVCTFAVISGGVLAQWEWSGSPYEASKLWVYARAEIEQFLGSKEDRQLVLVRYGSNHDIGDEWVWNTGKPESQHVIWAHSLSDDADSALLQACPDRTAWVLDVGKANCRLRRVTPELRTSDEEIVFAFRQDTVAQQRRIAGESARRHLTATGTP